jgi:plasmid stability protein
MVPIWNHYGGNFVPTITVKNIPPELYERLKQTAKANRRSINSEVIVCIERAMSTQQAHPEEIVAKARRLREKTTRYVISDDEFTRLKSEGRL